MKKLMVIAALALLVPLIAAVGESPNTDRSVLSIVSVASSGNQGSI